MSMYNRGVCSYNPSNLCTIWGDCLLRMQQEIAKLGIWVTTQRHIPTFPPKHSMRLGYVEDRCCDPLEEREVAVGSCFLVLLGLDFGLERFHVAHSAARDVMSNLAIFLHCQPQRQMNRVGRSETQFQPPCGFPTKCLTERPPTRPGSSFSWWEGGRGLTHTHAFLEHYLRPKHQIQIGNTGPGVWRGILSTDTGVTHKCLT